MEGKKLMDELEAHNLTEPKQDVDWTPTPEPTYFLTGCESNGHKIVIGALWLALFFIIFALLF